MKYVKGKLYTSSVHNSSVKGATIVMCIGDSISNGITFECAVVYSDDPRFKYYTKGDSSWERCSNFPYEYVGNFVLNNVSNDLNSLN